MYNSFSTSCTNLKPEDYERMADFPTICHGLSIIKSLLSNYDWHITSTKSKKRAEWLDGQLRKNWDVFQKDANESLVYGNAPMFKEWTEEDGYFVIKNMTPLKPHYNIILKNDNDEFAGIEQRFYFVPGKVEVTQYTPDQLFMYVYDMKFNDYYGRSRLRGARMPYVVYKYILEMTNIFMENFADPTKVAYAPPGKGQPKDGVEKLNVEIMADMMKKMSKGGAKDIALPSETDEKGERRWDLKLLESSRTGADYIEYLKYLEVKMLHGCMIPELSFTQSNSGGSYNLFENQSTYIAASADMDKGIFARYVEKYYIDALVYYNYGVGDMGKYKFEFTKSAKIDRQLINQTLQAAAQNDQIEADWEQLSRITGIKFTKKTPVEQITKQIADKANGEKIEGEKKPKQLVFDFHDHKKLEMEKRALTPYEKKVDFEKINNVYNTQDDIVNKLAAIKDKMEKKAISALKKPYEAGDIDALTNFSIDFKKNYSELFEDELMGVFDSSFGLASKEVKAKRDLSKADKAVQQAKAQEFAGKQISDIEFGVKALALGAIKNNLTYDQFSAQINDFMNGFNDKMKVGITMSVHEFVDDARRTAADKSDDVEMAQFSAILDDRTCELCAYLDGKYTKVDSDEYNTLSPSNLHAGCRCVWVYILSGEEGAENIEANMEMPPETLDKYLRR